ncbi:glycosyl transferase [Flavobacterium davisii]|uniref:Glycosyl transferase n=1 Tax=Flavobacterium davisii TaxID=2906077 RepID=A0A246GH10_9FLAO|nr:glycosyltransferase [Flavobacterium davisii]OWP82806.1 glycosyl transferase [Flavobacterium davisii]
MKLVIISAAPLIKKKDRWYAYAPYVYELEIWAKFVDQVVISCPIWESENRLLVTPLNFKIKEVVPLYEFNIKSFIAGIKGILAVVRNLLILVKLVQQADHIHLRCPGNMGLLGAIIQIFFPKKKKTAKYAGNWDPKAKQPWSYKLQKWILSNTILTKNMQVLVYGEWPNQTKNIKPFFTATYKEKERREKYFSEKFNNLSEQEIKFLFVGTLTFGKRPLYVIQIVERLLKEGYNVSLELYGEGILKKELLLYVKQNNLQNFIFFRGNQTKENLKEAYINRHFLILPSQSEGWPKAVAEAMFWGTIPLVSRVSCVFSMLNNEERGFLIDCDLDKDVDKIIQLIKDYNTLKKTSERGQLWAQYYTIEEFELGISKILI